MQTPMQGQMGMPNMQAPYNINQPGTMPQGMPAASAIPGGGYAATDH